MEKGNMIEVTKLTKTFKTLKAIDEISFTVKKGEIFGLLVPTVQVKVQQCASYHSGKPTSGSATIGGYHVVKDDDPIGGK